MSNFPIKVGDTSGIDTYVSTLTNGEEQLLITRDGKQYLSKGDGTKIEVSDIIVVDTLPSTNIQQNKIYILNTNFSLNYYDGSWHVLGSNQIVIGNTNADTSKLWLDTTSTPILKYYNGTSWINISGSVDTSTLLDKTTYKGSADGIVKQADALTGLTSTPTQIDNTVNNSIIVDNTNRANGKVIGWDNGQNKYLDLTVAGIVGSAGIISVSGSPVTITKGTEAIFAHPSASDDKIIINVQEQIAGSSTVDTHVDFSDSSKYTLQDSGKIVIGDNKAQLDVYTKFLMHIDSSFTDEYGHTVINNGVVLDTINKKFGNGSGYFNGIDNSINIGSDSFLNFGLNDFSIDFWFKSPTQVMAYSAFFAPNSGLSLFCSDGSVGGFISVTLDNTRIIVENQNYNDNIWHHLELSRKNGVFYLFIDASLRGTTSSYTTTAIDIRSLLIGVAPYSPSNSRYIGNIDEFRISNIARHTSSFSLETQYYNPYSIPNIPTYFKTTGLSDYSLTTINTITSLTIPVNLPTNTSCKILTSFDNGINYLYRSGGVWNKYTGDMSIDWTSSNSNTDLQTYFTNLTIAQLTSDLSSLGITPILLDFCFQLSTSDLIKTPSISTITIAYESAPHTELASFGSYDEVGVIKFGVKRMNNSTLVVKNLTNKDRTVSVNVLIGN